MTIALVVAASGESRRMGRDKAFLPAPPAGRPYVSCIVETAARAGAELRVVVVGTEAMQARIRGLVGGLAEVIVNPRWQDGMLTSYQAGVARVLGSVSSLGESARGALLWPVDHPLIDADTLRGLVAQGDRLTVPTHRGRAGHPLWLPARLFPELCALDGTSPECMGARTLLERRRAELGYLEVTDPGVVRDVDTPADHARLWLDAGLSLPG